MHGTMSLKFLEKGIQIPSQTCRLKWLIYWGKFRIKNIINNKSLSDKTLPVYLNTYNMYENMNKKTVWQFCSDKHILQLSLHALTLQSLTKHLHVSLKSELVFLEMTPGL